jgi:hypothetical protein
MPAPSLTPLAAALLRVPAPERALVLGADVADPALLLAREFPSARVRGASRSQAAVREAIERLGLDPEGRIAFKVLAGRRLPYPDDFFDLVVLLDAHPAPAAIEGTMRPSGLLVLVRTRPPSALGSLRDAILLRRLRGRGLTEVEQADAGDGNFVVARLGSATGATAAD